MEIKFADSFWKSLERLRMHQTWWYKTYECFRYKIPMFFENIWYFRKELWEFRSWDYSFNLRMFGRSLEKTANTLEFYGWEIEETRMKKVERIKRVVQIIKSLDEGDYINRAEKELGELKNSSGWRTGVQDTPEEREHNKKVFELSRQIEENEWNELFDILKGQDHQEYKEIINKLTYEEQIERDHWKNWFDGSGMKHWWD